jgi:homoserine kinase
MEDHPLNEPTNATDFAVGAEMTNRIPPATGFGISGLSVAAQAESQNSKLTVNSIRIIVAIGGRVPKATG